MNFYAVHCMVAFLVTLSGPRVNTFWKTFKPGKSWNSSSHGNVMENAKLFNVLVTVHLYRKLNLFVANPMVNILLIYCSFKSTTQTS